MAISMRTAVKLLDIRVYGEPGSDPVPTDVHDTTILCPVCSKEHTSRRLTLNINFENNVFNCPRCSFSGGVNKLISHYTGWPQDEVKDHIERGELSGYQPGNEETEGAGWKEPSTKPIAPISRRDETYRAMLGLLTLSDAHRQNLLQRGLREETIERIMFRTYPKFMDPTVIPKKLAAAGYNLSGVPGFAINNKGEWLSAAGIGWLQSRSKTFCSVRENIRLWKEIQRRGKGSRQKEAVLQRMGLPPASELLF